MRVPSAPRGIGLLVRTTRLLLAFCGCLLLETRALEAGGFSLRFHGNGVNAPDLDRVKIRVDDPANNLPGPPADVGATDFTLEFWMRATSGENTAPAVTCGANLNWIFGNIVFDRDRFNQDRKFGLSIAGGVFVFGVTGDGTSNPNDLTICGGTNVLNDQWHHVAVARRRSDGWMWLYVDGVLDAQGDGPDGDVSYPDDGVPGNFCGGPCTNSDPFLVIGAEKHDAGAQYPSYGGWVDEVRISNALRYAGAFTRPRQPFFADVATVGLYHFDEGSSNTVFDESGAAGGPSNGVRRFGGSPAGPEWSTDMPPFTAGNLWAINQVTGGLSSPVGLANAGDNSGRMFIVQQGGAIRIWNGTQLLATPFLNISNRIVCCGEQGLLDLAFHPNYESNGFFYVYYTSVANATPPARQSGDVVIARYQVTLADPNVADANSESILLVVPHSTFGNHNGGHLAFGPDGYLYISIGDGGGGGDPFESGQNLSTLLGKQLRIDVNGGAPYSIPSGNPFPSGGAGTCGNGCDEIWAYGLRNPWRYSFDRLTGDIYIGDVGQNTWEEVDFQPAATLGGSNNGGRNYGWDVLEGGLHGPASVNANPPGNCFENVPAGSCNAFLSGGSTLPIMEYDHSLGCVATGGYVYRGRPRSFLSGNYVFADECSGRIWRGIPNGAGAWTQQELIDTTIAITSFGEDEQGGVYFTSYFGGSLQRFAPYTFADVTPTTFGWQQVESLFAAGITTGCGGTSYCPTSNITRGQMAVFLLRSRHDQTFLPPPATGTVFSDVPQTHPFAAWIEQLYVEGITSGCATNPLRYCPDGSVTRAQMAVFILRARYGSGYVPGQCDGIFTDVPCGGFFAPWIEDLYDLGITTGCVANPLQYCPSNPVTRAQMAVFLVRAWSLP